jgi:DNA-dependent RNA polymerase auxiliary subunit epsilon
MDDKFREYKRLVLAAIQEKDSQKQQDLIQRILQINAEISQEIRDELTALHSKPSSVEIIQNLTDQLLEYQKQYSDIQSSNDKLTTLRMIYTDNRQKLDQAESMYNLYVFGIMILCGLVGFLVFTTAVRSGYIMNNPIVNALSTTQAQYTDMYSSAR